MARAGERGLSRSVQTIAQKIEKQIQELRDEIKAIKKRVDKLEQ